MNTRKLRAMMRRLEGMVVDIDEMTSADRERFDAMSAEAQDRPFAQRLTEATEILEDVSANIDAARSALEDLVKP